MAFQEACKLYHAVFSKVVRQVMSLVLKSSMMPVAMVSVPIEGEAVCVCVCMLGSS